MTELTVTAHIYGDDRERVIAETGHTARVLLLLSEAGGNGLTARNIGTPPETLAALCQNLRDNQGLSISQTVEKNHLGWESLYALSTPVEIVSVDGDLWEAANDN